MNSVNLNEFKHYVDGKKDGVIINVLPEKSHEKGHIPNSHNVPLSTPDFTQKVERLVDSKDEDIIVYCANNDCDASEKAAKRLDSDGFKNVKDFEGGIKEWKENDLNLKRPS